MKRKKKYKYVWFDPRSIERIISEFQDIVKHPEKTEFIGLSIQKGNEDWSYDTIEEFLSELRGEADYARVSIMNPDLSLTIVNWPPSFFTSTDVEMASGSRERIIRIGNVVDMFAEDCFVPPPPEPEKVPPKPKIFIGHGGSQQWRDLKDHLQDQHGYEIVSYETGSRAGHAIRDIIAELLGKSSFAILVMTGEDTMENVTVRARQNVIHEIGLFQGRLGFTKAIVLKEDGTEEFSNIHGVNQIRYSRGNIRETFGDVLATLSKEFGKRR
jgi:hypothetical protein